MSSVSWVSSHCLVRLLQGSRPSPIDLPVLPSLRKARCRNNRQAECMDECGADFSVMFIRFGHDGVFFHPQASLLNP